MMRATLLFFLLLPSLAFAGGPYYTNISGYQTCGTIGAYVGYTSSVGTIYEPPPPDPSYRAMFLSNAWSMRIYNFTAGTQNYTGYWRYQFTQQDCPPAHCTNTVLDGNETQIDCGGSCSVCTEPAHCTNGFRDWDDPNSLWLEDGIDCGAACDTPDDTCSIYGPDGWLYESRIDPATGLAGPTIFYAPNDDPEYTTAAVGGVCPAGYYINLSGNCSAYALPILANSSYGQAPDPDPNANPWNVATTTNADYTSNQITTNNPDGSTTTVTTSTVETTVNNVPSVVETTKTTITHVDGTVHETTIINNYTQPAPGVVYGNTTTTENNYNAGGTLTSSTSNTAVYESSPGTITTQQPGYGGTPAAVYTPGPDISTATGTPITSTPGQYDIDAQTTASADSFDADLGLFVTRFASFRANVSNSAVFGPMDAIFSGPDTSGKSAVFDLSMGSYGSPSVTLADYDAVWNALGIVFVALACFAAGRLVLVNKG